jgi:hypothetical protein
MVGIEKNEILYTVKTTVHFYSSYTGTFFATGPVTLLTGVVLVLLYIQVTVHTGGVLYVALYRKMFCFCSASRWYR